MNKNSQSLIFHIRRHLDLYLLIASFCVSLVALIYFISHGHMNLANYDVVARLNASRKVIDSITPGVGQLGGIWLPFPQVLMLPFIWNNYLWHSGLAGYFISGLSFILGAVYLQKTAYFLTNNRRISLLIWFLFISNINILLLQTMAMSEMFFMFCLILVCYCLIVWIKNHDILYFLLSAFFVMLLTLTRYEGYFVLLGAVIVVLLESFRSFRKEGKDKIEGMLLLFLTVAGFGIILWCIYSALFYKDPLFWLHSYSQTSTLAIPKGKYSQEDVYGNLEPTLFDSLAIYTVVMFFTNGLITVALGILGMLLYFYSFIKKTVSKEKTLLLMPVAIISLVVFIFLIIGYFIGFIPHIEFPPVLLKGMKIRDWSVYADSNVRYGMVLLPCILLFVAFAAGLNKRFLYIITLLIGIQLFLNLVSPKLLQYPFVSSWRYSISSDDAHWFASNYDGGLVLLSASRHEDFIFQSGLPYKDFIYEGTREYWRDSLKNPAKYAKWIVYNYKISGDTIATGVTQEGSSILRKKFHLAYSNKGLEIYKLNAN